MVNVEVGDRAETGAALIELDREIGQLTLEALRASTRQARAELAYAKRRYNDAERLREQKNISENELRLREAEVEIDCAVLKQKQAEEQRQQARVNRHILRAPFAGVISERLTENGEWIEPGSPVLALVAIDDLRIEFRVPQEFFSSVNPNSTLSVTLDALPDANSTAPSSPCLPALTVLVLKMSQPDQGLNGPADLQPGRRVRICRVQAAASAGATRLSRVKTRGQGA